MILLTTHAGSRIRQGEIICAQCLRASDDCSCERAQEPEADSTVWRGKWEREAARLATVTLEHPALCSVPRLLEYRMPWERREQEER